MKEARSGLPCELLHADDLVIMATTRDDLSKKMVEWSTFVGQRIESECREDKDDGRRRRQSSNSVRAWCMAL